MLLKTRTFAGLVLAASGLVLGGALASEYWGGLVPCELCLLQRWPWAAAIVISITALMVGYRRALPWVAGVLGLDFVVSAAFAFYHLGVEQRWFAGPTACTSGPSGADTLAEMKARILGHAPVMCDQVQWSLFGVSMAGWNLLASLIMLAICVAVVRHRQVPARAADLRRGIA